MALQTLESEQPKSVGGRRASELLRSVASSGGGRLGLTVLGLYLLTAAAAVALPPQASLGINTNHILQGPTFEHPFGTDQLGRNQLARVIEGALTSLTIIVPATTGALVAGTLLGLAAGYVGGALDNLVMRIMDVFFAFPPVLLALTIVAGMGAGQLQLVVAIGIVYTPMFVRTARGPTLQLRNREFVSASLLAGAGSVWILRRHILPNVVPILIVQATLTLGWALLTEASLSFLGLGVQPPAADWGSMLNEARRYLTLNPWLAVFPGAAVVSAVLALNLLGDSLREALDPRLKS
jgi:peptide/nickel transport system permease protein